MTDVLSGILQLQMPPDVMLLTPDAVQHLRMPWDGRFTSDELRRITEVEPNLAVWNRRTGEYVIGGDWRHREEIANVVELAATAGAIDLMHGLAALAQTMGKQLLVASEQAERRRQEFFHAAGMEELERIVVYELARIRPGRVSDARMCFERVRRDDPVASAELLELDHHAFPWLWWNNAREFGQYHDIEGVAVDVARNDIGRMIAYVGTTRFRGWGHLDRIAVDPELQGDGLGKRALDYAVTALATAGAKRVGLSTQSRNERSRRLYEAYGFQRTPSHDYSVFGRWLGASARDSAEGQSR